MEETTQVLWYVRWFSVNVCRSATYARPMQKIRLSNSFFFVCSCRCQIMGTGIKNIQMSVIKFEMLVK